MQLNSVLELCIAPCIHVKVIKFPIWKNGFQRNRVIKKKKNLIICDLFSICDNQAEQSRPHGHYVDFLQVCKPVHTKASREQLINSNLKITASNFNFLLRIFS